MPGLPVRPTVWPEPSSATPDPDPDPDPGPSRRPRHPARVVEAQQDEAVLRGHPLPLGHGGVHNAHPAPPVDLRRHPEEGDHGRLDHPGVDGGHHQLAGVLLHDVADGFRRPRHERGPALAARARSGRPGRVSQSGTPKVSTSSAPLHAVALARVQLAEVAALPHRAEGRRARAHHGAQALGRLRRPAAAPRSTASSPAAARRSRRGGRPARPPERAPGRSAPCSPSGRR